MNNEHYLKKIERNSYVAERAPFDIQGQVMANVRWCRDMAARLNYLDYDLREETIRKIHSILDNDYKRMGYTIEEDVEEEKGRSR